MNSSISKSSEFDDNGNWRFHMVYCNPSAPYQKGSCEAGHEMIRRIITKGIDITPYSQEQINLMMCHMNSYQRKLLGNRSPYETFAFSVWRTSPEMLWTQEYPIISF